MAEATKQKTCGKDFLIWADPQQMEAVRIVQFFFALARVVARNAGHNEIQVTTQALNNHLQFFIIMYWPKNIYGQNVDGLCPALDLNHRADDYYNQVERLSKNLYLHTMPPAPLSQEYLADIMARAREVGLISSDVSQEDLLRTTKLTLERMLGQYFEPRA